MSDGAPGLALGFVGAGIVAGVLSLALRRERFGLLPLLFWWALWSVAALLSVVNTLE